MKSFVAACAGSLAIAGGLVVYPAATLAQEDPAVLYRMGCLACHGEDGRGFPPDHPALASFDPPPADFTDPLFNSREPAADWFLVTKHGGAALGLSDQMPAYGDVWSDRQIDSVIGYVKGMASAAAYPPGDLNFVRPVRTIKAFPEDEVLIISRYDSEVGAADALRTTLYFARRFGARFQYEIKGTTIDRGRFDSEEEIELGLKWAFQHDLRRMLLNAVGLEVEIPLDGGSDVVIPYWSLAKGLGERFTFQSTVRSHLPTEDAGEGDLELSAVVHWQPSPWPRRPFPGLELQLTQPFRSGADFEATLLPQILVGLSKGGHVGIAVGAELPLSDQSWDYRLHAFLVWDYADGPLWRGW